jgi:hypothetical protein
MGNAIAGMSLFVGEELASTRGPKTYPLGSGRACSSEAQRAEAAGAGKLLPYVRLTARRPNPPSFRPKWRNLSPIARVNVDHPRPCHPDAGRISLRFVARFFRSTDGLSARCFLRQHDGVFRRGARFSYPTRDSSTPTATFARDDGLLADASTLWGINKR